MKAALQQAYNELDQARTKSWALWKMRLKWHKGMGTPFEVAFEATTGQLLYELAPFYNKVAEAAGFEPADP